MTASSSETILLSIHPEHVYNIIKGIKRFELRRRIPLHIKQIAIYATAPESRIIGMCHVEEILSDTPDVLWPKVCGAANVTRQFYQKYFQSAKTAFAIRLGRLNFISRMIPLSHQRLKKTPPQSFIYLDDKLSNWLVDCSDKMISGGTKKIFIGGIHGSGKTYLSRKIISSYGYHCISASQLIEDGHGEINNNKTVSYYKENQQYLLSSLKTVQSNYSHLAIDGHFCLINKQGDIEKIPLETFEHLNPVFIILAMPPATSIQKRLDERCQKIRLRESLESFREKEFHHATSVAKFLDVPLKVIDTSQNDASLHEQVNDLFNIETHSESIIMTPTTARRDDLNSTMA